MWRVPSLEDGLEQPGLGARQGERDRLEHLERLLGKSGGASEDGVPHRRGHSGLTGGEHLGDEERVPARPRVQVGGVDRVPDRELTDGGGRERFQREPVDGRRRGEVAEQHAHRVIAVRGRRRDRCR